MAKCCGRWPSDSRINRAKGLSETTDGELLKWSYVKVSCGVSRALCGGGCLRTVVLLLVPLSSAEVHVLGVRHIEAGDEMGATGNEVKAVSMLASDEERRWMMHMSSSKTNVSEFTVEGGLEKWL